MYISWVLSWSLSHLCPRRLSGQIIFCPVGQTILRFSWRNHPERYPSTILLAEPNCNFLWALHLPLSAEMSAVLTILTLGGKKGHITSCDALTDCSQSRLVLGCHLCMRCFQGGHLVVTWSKQLVMITSTGWGSHKLKVTNLICCCRWRTSLRDMESYPYH